MAPMTRLFLSTLIGLAPARAAFSDNNQTVGSESDDQVDQLSDMSCKEAQSRLSEMRRYHFLRDNPRQDYWIVWSKNDCGPQETATSVFIQVRDQSDCAFGYVCVYLPSVTARERSIDQQEARGTTTRASFFGRKNEMMFPRGPSSATESRSSTSDSSFSSTSGSSSSQTPAPYNSDRAWSN